MPLPITYHLRNSTYPIRPDSLVSILGLFSSITLNTSSLGPVDMGTVQKVAVKVTDEEKARQERIKARPPLSEILNLHDFEVSLGLCPIRFNYVWSLLKGAFG